MFKKINFAAKILFCLAIFPLMFTFIGCDTLFGGLTTTTTVKDSEDSTTTTTTIEDSTTTTTTTTTLEKWTTDNKIFIAVGAAGATHEAYSIGINGSIVYLSKDGGITWVEKYSKGIATLELELTGIASGNGKIVAVGGNGNIIVSSDAGETWTKVEGLPTLNGKLYDVAFGNGLFVAVGSISTVIYSKDGITWKTETSSSINLVGTNHYRGVRYINNKFFILGSFERIMTVTTDGEKLTFDNDIKKSTTFGQYLDSIAYGNGTYVAVGYGLNGYYSTDGVNWTDVKALGNNLRVIYADGRFTVANSHSYETGVTYSTDGVTWTNTKKDKPFYNVLGGIYDVEYGNGRYVAVGNRGNLYLSKDGVEWVDSGVFANSVNSPRLDDVIYIEK